MLLLSAVKVDIPAEFGQKQQLARLQQYLNQTKIFHCRVYAKIFRVVMCRVEKELSVICQSGVDTDSNKSQTAFLISNVEFKCKI